MMPVINLDALERMIGLRCSENLDEFVTLARLIIKKSGELRASKPQTNGNAAYVWRMVVFMVSPISRHHCMPVCADFDIEVEHQVPKFGTVDEATYSAEVHTHSEIRRNKTKHLDELVDLIVELVPVNQRHGLLRWGHALYGY